MQPRLPQHQDSRDISLGVVDTDVAAVSAPASPAHRLSLLNALLSLLLEDIPLESQLETALDIVLGMSAAPVHPQGAVFLADENTDTLKLVASRNLVPGNVGCVQFSFGQRLCCRAEASGEYRLIDSATPCCEVERENLKPFGNHSMLLRRDGKTLGVLMLSLNPERPPGVDELEFLGGVADVLAGMIAHNRDVQRIRRVLEVNRQLNRQILTRQEEEYRRIARELHDEIGQSIAAIKTEVSLLSKPPAPGETRRSAQAIGTEADRIYETIHETVRRLRPGVLDDLGLVPAIEAHVADWQSRRPLMSCRLNVEGQFEDLDEAVRVTAYRLVQECLTNVVRHATATEVRITLLREIAESDGLRGWLTVEVADNGRGMEAAKLNEQTGRFGLLGMRERVEGLAGIFSIETAAGSGFRLRARLPLIEHPAAPRRSRG